MHYAEPVNQVIVESEPVVVGPPQPVYRPKPMNVDPVAYYPVQILHDHNSSNDEPNNIFNINGATMGLGDSLECARVSADSVSRGYLQQICKSLCFTWQEDVLNCPSGHLENTFLTLYSPAALGKEVVDELAKNLVREVIGTAVPAGRLRFSFRDVFACRNPLACDHSYFVSGI